MTTEIKHKTKQEIINTIGTLLEKESFEYSQNAFDFLFRAYVMKQKFADISLEIKEPISTLRNWNRILNNVWRDLANVSNLSRRKQISVHNFWDFYEWYNTPDKKCQYCGITENQLELLNAQTDVINKRNSTRGKSLEIDRKVSSEKYENIKNLAWSLR